MCANKTAIRYITSFLRNAQAGPASSIRARFRPREHLIEQVRCFFVCSVFSEPNEHGVLRALKRQKKKKTGLNQTAKQLFGCKQTLGISVLILQAGEKMYQVEVQVKTLTVPEWLEKYCQPEKFVPLCRECPQYGKNWSCPPGMTTAAALAGGYRYVQVIGLKVKYDEQVLREAEHSPAEDGRAETGDVRSSQRKRCRHCLHLNGSFRVQRRSWQEAVPCAGRVQGRRENRADTRKRCGIPIPGLALILAESQRSCSECRFCGRKEACRHTPLQLPHFCTTDAWAKDRRLFVNLASEL